MVKAVFDELSAATPKNHFTIGIRDDVTHTSLTYDESFSTEHPDNVRAIFYGLGSDGTVGANKNSIKTRPTMRRDTSSMTRKNRGL